MHLRERSSIANCTDFLMASVKKQAKHDGHLTNNTLLDTE